MNTEVCHVHVHVYERQRYIMGAIGVQITESYCIDRHNIAVFLVIIRKVYGCITIDFVENRNHHDTKSVDMIP